MNYKHLSQIERYQIHRLMKAQHNITQIARLLGRDKSTISRELRRNAGCHGYKAQHHRCAHLLPYVAYWLHAWVRKFSYILKNQSMQESLLRDSIPYYFMPFQHDIDSQVVYHSNYSGNMAAANDVLRSFASNALPGTLMVVKEHPHGRGSNALKVAVHSLAQELGVADRLVYLVEGNTPRLVKNARGVILINSTVGIRAIQHQVPLIALGRAICNLPEVCFQGVLNDFWTKAKAPDQLAANAFLTQFKNLTQVSADIYAPRNIALSWPR
jgi:capsular polysaccharide export protein